jgi:hypothetical protein
MAFRRTCTQGFLRPTTQEGEPRALERMRTKWRSDTLLLIGTGEAEAAQSSAPEDGSCTVACVRIEDKFVHLETAVAYRRRRRARYEGGIVCSAIGRGFFLVTIATSNLFITW